mmetsp:Transcript_21634/g.38564  ORF Transcript_21634/g.38564 Transcript_21634/m.38564 type:complete len:176 (-) Transcript_21634:86-613(-)
MELPKFWSYPPYFTLQPVAETREKQISLWHDLILSYCKRHKIYVIPSNAAENFPLFENKDISRRLNQDAISTILGAAVTAGKAEWVNSAQQNCIIYWRSLEDWAQLLHSFAQSTGMSDVVMTVDEISTGLETKGTDLEGVHKEVLLRAIQRLESRGHARLFKGGDGDDDGVKFFV